MGKGEWRRTPGPIYPRAASSATEILQPWLGRGHIALRPITEEIERHRKSLRELIDIGAGTED